jgi:hypothetical protein
MKETESMDNRDKEEICLAIKDLGDVMESLHMKTSTKIKDLKTNHSETSTYMENEFKLISDEFKGFNSLFDENKAEVIFC